MHVFVFAWGVSGHVVDRSSIRYHVGQQATDEG
jgi:hypothetical protein